MCCGANSHPCSRAIEGSYTRTTLKGKHSDESNAAYKIEWSYIYMTPYTFIM
jgi:hypothetical protein